jgi:hypothetical protein
MQAFGANGSRRAAPSRCEKKIYWRGGAGCRLGLARACQCSAKRRCNERSGLRARSLAHGVVATHHRIGDPRTRRAISQMSEARSLEANIGTATRRVGSGCRAVDVTLCLAVSVSLPSLLENFTGKPNENVKNSGPPKSWWSDLHLDNRHTNHTRQKHAPCGTAYIYVYALIYAYADGHGRKRSRESSQRRMHRHSQPNDLPEIPSIPQCLSSEKAERQGGGPA